nr:hypothetical protein [Ligilactobacillus ubinensis]
MNAWFRYFYCGLNCINC